VEVLQALVRPDVRTFSWLDMVANLLGAASVSWILLLRRRGAADTAAGETVARNA
jgi:hypothetical protein